MSTVRVGLRPCWPVGCTIIIMIITITIIVITIQ